MGERLEVVETPLFMRGAVPLTGYQRPAPFDGDVTGCFLLTPVDMRRDKAAQERQLRGHCAPALPLHVLRGAYPGLHVLQTGTRRAPTRLRQVAASAVFTQGWTAWAEDAMQEAGFFGTDPLTPLFLLADRLERACMAVIDIGLQCGHLTTGEAASLLVSETRCEPGEAAAKVRACCTSPLRAATALVGSIAFRELHEEGRKRLGARFSLGAFNDALLAGGAIPAALVREELWERLGVA
jgi:uncharacterized protein (DUF885 family)